MANETKEPSAYDDFINWIKGFDDAKAKSIRQHNRENLKKVLKELRIKIYKMMEKQKRLPNVIFMSPKASKIIENITTEDVACIETDANGISVKNASLSDADIDKTAAYRNIVQLWHPADEQPHCIGSLLCWRRGGTFFVHEHYDHNEHNWKMFVSTNNVQRYCYIANLEPDKFF